MAGGSSGAWKLALADFMISMMCIFLTLWILQFLDKTEAQQLVDILAPEQENVPELMVLPSKNSISPIQLDHIATSRFDSDRRRIDSTSLVEGKVESQQDLQVLAEVVKESVKGIDGSGAIDVQVTPQGLKITVADTGHGPMFKSGSTNIMPYYQDLLLNIAPAVGGLKNKVVVAGHTDASRFIGSDRTNWDLSARRANKARYYLQRGGIPQKGFFQVIGFGDSALLYPDNPRGAENRRIEIVVLTKSAEDKLKSVYHTRAFEGQPITNETLEEVKTGAADVSVKNKPITQFEALKNAIGVN